MKVYIIDYEHNCTSGCSQVERVVVASKSVDFAIKKSNEENPGLRINRCQEIKLNKTKIIEEIQCSRA